MAKNTDDIMRETAGEELETFDDTTEEEKQFLIGEQKLIEQELMEKFKPDFLRVIKKIAYYLSQVGLPFSEACILARSTEKEMRKHMEDYPIIGEFFTFKELRHKADMMSVVAQKARDGDDKLAVFLLQSKFPDEFNTKKRTGGGDGSSENLLSAALRAIRTEGDSKPLVLPPGERQSIKIEQDGKTARLTLEQILA